MRDYDNTVSLLISALMAFKAEILNL